MTDLYPVARGFARAGKGEPDEARAARYVLKDYVNAKLLYCHSPPDVDSDEFNTSSNRLAIARLQKLGKKKAPTTRVGKDADSFIPSAASQSSGASTPSGQSQAQSGKSQALDRDFFANNAMGYRTAVNGRGAAAFPHQGMVGADGRPLNPKQARMAALMAGDGGKKHHKIKREKHRSGKGYD